MHEVQAKSLAAALAAMVGYTAWRSRAAASALAFPV